MASLAVPLDELFAGGGGAADELAQLEGLEFEGEAGKAVELNPIGVTANSLTRTSATGGAAETGAVAADSRKALQADSLFTGEDEAFAFRRAASRLREMGSDRWRAAWQREQQLMLQRAARGGGTASATGGFVGSVWERVSALPAEPRQ